jgi:general secretion pathway protein M
VRQWFDSLAPRERLLLAVTAVIVVLAVLYAGVWEPLNQGVAHMHKEVKRQAQLIAWLDHTAPKVKALRAGGHHGAPKAQGTPLLTIIDKTSKDKGLDGHIQRIQPRGDDAAQVWVAAAPFDNMLAWLYRLQARYGVTILSISLKRGDNTGQVNGHLSLERKPRAGS